MAEIKNLSSLIKKVSDSASMKEQDTEVDGKKFKKKMIKLPEEIDNRIKKVYSGTCASFIMTAIHEKLQKYESK